MRYDWRPIIKDLMIRLEGAGFKAYEVDDGDEEVVPVSGFKQTTEAVCAVDVATVYFEADGCNKWLEIVLGNEPCEVVSAYGYADNEVGKLFSEIISEHGTDWENKAIPVRDEEKDRLFRSLTATGSMIPYDGFKVSIETDMWGRVIRIRHIENPDVYAHVHKVTVGMTTRIEQGDVDGINVGETVEVTRLKVKALQLAVEIAEELS